MKTTITEIACPQCKKPVVWSEDSPYRPFCSKRCQLIDWGEWAEEKYSIAVNEDDPMDQEEW